MVNTIVLANRRLGRKKYLFMVVVYCANLTDRLQKGKWSMGSFAMNMDLEMCARGETRTPETSSL